MKPTQFLLFAISLISFGCHSNNSSMAQETNDEYLRLKSKFDSKLVDQFPQNLTTEIAFTTANTDLKKNSVGIFLYEYKVSSKVVDSIESYLKKKEGLEKYKSDDSCLLIVNRFETKHTEEYGIVPPIMDSSLVNKQCYDKLKPIPNFVNYDGENIQPCGLDSTFDIYVLETEAGKFSEKYNELKPFAQMPLKWRNGYSKGIALSKKNQSIIYWSIVW